MSSPTDAGPKTTAPVQTPVGPSARWSVTGVCLGLAAITFAVFGQTLWHQFVNFDDAEYVAKNPVVAQGLTLKGLVWAFAGPHSANWHPLTWLSHMLDCQLYGLEPGGHHLSSVLLHAATAIALFLLLLRLTNAFWRSAFVAAVFAIHPLRAESVAWVAERKDVLSGLFFMLTLWAYALFVKSKVQSRETTPLLNASRSSAPRSDAPRSTRSARYYALALICFTLALMSKPMVVTLPFVLFLLDYWPLERFQVKNQKSKIKNLAALLREKLPFLALSIASSLVTLLSQRSAVRSFESFPLLSRMEAAVSSCKIYLLQMVYPGGLAAFYPFPFYNSGRDAAVAGVLLLLISAVVWEERRTRPWLLVGWLWYLVMLLPVLGLVQVGGQAHADRYTYLPQIGIYLAITWLAADLAARRHWRPLPMGALMGLVLATLMACAWNQTAYWKNSETLWRHALECTTGNNLAFVNLGHELFEQRRFDEVVIHYQKGLELQPNNREFHNNLANALREQGKLDEALTHYQRAAQIAPDSVEAQFNLGRALALLGKTDEAIARYEAAVRIAPGFVRARMSLGNALVQQGKTELAAGQFKKILELRPNDAGAHLNLGLCLFQMGKMAEAKAEYEQARDFAPADPGIQNNLAWLLATCPVASLRDGGRAVELAQQANTRTGGDKPLILRTLAAALAEAGRFPEAVETAERAASLAQAQSAPDLAKQIEFELNLYRDGKPFPRPDQSSARQD